MTTLQEIQDLIETRKGDITYRTFIDRGYAIPLAGRRGNHDFVVTTNYRTLRSGPNHGKIRVDGVIITMFGNKDRLTTEATIIRKADRFLPELDLSVQIISYND